ncbi:MAG: hypothetical protein ACRELA_10415 [Candidatus Rokuibacteriota bacterium]
MAWLIARDSASLGHLLHTVRYEGHPPLWHLCLYLLTRITTEPFAMQLLHLVVATAVVFVVTRFAPFTRLQKILFAFGYFPFFEYATISRNYAFGLLFTFAFCASYARKRTPSFASAVILVLLAQTSVHGIILAGGLGLAAACDAILLVRSGGTLHTARWRVAGSAGVWLAGIAVSLAQVIPPPDSGFGVAWKTDGDLRWAAATIGKVWRGVVPIPELSYHFWNTNILDVVPHVQTVLALLLLVASFLLVGRRPATLALSLCGTAGLLGLWYVKYPGFVRHHGHVFILLLAACWLSETCVEWTGRPRLLGPLVGAAARHRSRLVTGLLALHVVAGVYASGLDLLLPFSASREAARFIEAHYPQDVAIVGHVDTAVMAVAGYLHRPIYYPRYRRFGTFIVFDHQRRRVTFDEVVAQVAELVSQTQRDVLLLVTREPALGIPFDLVQRFDDAIVESERYRLYLARPGP